MTTEPSAEPAVSTARSPLGGPRRSGWLTLARDVVIILAIAILVSLVVKTFLVRSFYIPSSSMENTLQVNDRILVDEVTPRFGGYHRGDVIVFRDPGGWLPVTTAPSRAPLAEATDWVLSLVGLSAPDSDDHLIKRVIGLPGDHVMCCDDQSRIVVNGTALDESEYVKVPPGQSVPTPYAFDVVVPQNSLWVMGDNRDNSEDSRKQQDKPSRGFVPMDDVVGRAFVITWPFNRFGIIDFRPDVFETVPSPRPTPAPSR